MKTVGLLALALISFSALSSIDPYYEIDDQGMNVEILAEEECHEFHKSLPIGEIILATKEILVWGKKIFDIVEKNKGVAETSFIPVSVLPSVQGSQNHTLESMEHWQGAKVVKLNFSLQNYFRMKVVNMDYKVHFYHSGTFEDKGAYIKGLTVVPEYLDVMPGFKFTAKVEALEVVNAGTKEFPKPTLTLVLKLTVTAPAQTKVYTQMFQVSGDGAFKQL